jgi:lipid-A-disaccharide synthase
MSKPLHILMVAGDPSADRHAARLAQALKDRIAGLRISALGGTHLKSVADSFLFSLVDLGGFGFWEPLMKILPLRRALAAIQHLINVDRPDLVIPVDYYGFNIHTARTAARAGVPVAYYISPQVWASRPGRMKALAKVVQRMLVIFPFEVPLYEKAGVPVRFVGHPLLDLVPEPKSESPTTLKIGFLPGSRWGTVRRHLPIVMDTARQLHTQFPEADFLLFRPQEISAEPYAPFLEGNPWVRLVSDADYRERRELTLAITVSGTASLENMLLGIPMIIMYRLSWLTYRIARHLIRISYVGIPNILAGKPVVPELLQNECVPGKLAHAATRLIQDRDLYRQTRETLLLLRSSLQQGGTSRAADAIVELLQKPVEAVA